MSTRLEEELGPDAGHYLIGGTLLEQGHTGFQSYEVFDTPGLGKLFRLDGILMLTERDEYLYHETIVHIAGLAHPDPKRALVIGGGDGGTAEELLKYPGMEKVVMVELDGKVVDIARQHFASVHRGAFEDPRYELRIQDGLDYVRKDAPAAGQTFDLICLDLTDPIGPSIELYTEKFFRDCKALLAPGGGMSLHLGAPHHQAGRVQELYGHLARAFSHVTPFALYIPYNGSEWCFGVASDSLQPDRLTEAEIDQRAASRLRDLQFINGSTYRAVLAQSPARRQLFAGVPRAAAA